MRGLVGVASALLLGFGLWPEVLIVSGHGLGREAREHRRGGAASEEGSRAFDNGSRKLKRSGRGGRDSSDSSDSDDCETCDPDDAFDRRDSPEERARHTRRRRNEWADIEFSVSRNLCQASNGDRSSAASFHKTLPHDDLGQVDPAAFEALTECIYEGTFEKCEEVPFGDMDGFLINPTGGLPIAMGGPSSSSVTCPAVPALNSEQYAAQLAEVYWMSLTRDVAFSEYGENDITISAADNLATMPGFAKMPGVAVGPDGRADPQSQLFRSTAVGVTTGPMISQLLLKEFTLDSITVIPKQTTYVPGVDYMTNYDDWLFIQNGGKPDTPEKEDSVKRYIRNARDLSRLVYTDTIFTEALRGALILMDQDAISRAGFNGPYADSKRQKGFVSYGASHMMKILGSCEGAQRSAWYQKWNVHMFARPEAVAGTLHHVLHGTLDVEFHESLVGNDELLERVAAYNAAQNGDGEDSERVYLLSQAVKVGSPAHPSYPAGHAVQNGAFATVLKAMVGLERGEDCFKDPVYPDEEGAELLHYAGDECLTYAGEINKLAVNIAFGRQMCGVHYRFDSEEGLVLGETVGVRMLQQEAMSFPEKHPIEFRLFSGETIKIEADGSFYIDDNKCSGDAYHGVANC